jgi:hypothetical protein
MDTIRAEICRHDRCTAEGHTVRASAPVMAMCRELVAAGFDPGRPLEAYRGDVLALRVRSIGEGAGLTVEDNRFGTPVLRRWKARQGMVAALPVRPIAEAVGATLRHEKRPRLAPGALSLLMVSGLDRAR